LTWKNYLQNKKKNFLLVTQNVDGLHLRAGSSPERTYQIHGNINFMRCYFECSLDLHPIKPEVKGEISCPKCNKLARPHVLWFDESYDEPLYKWDSTLKASKKMDCLLLIGTTLQTNLPSRLVSIANTNKVPVIEINPEPSKAQTEVTIAQKSGEVLPKLVKHVEHLFDATK